MKTTVHVHRPAPSCPAGASDADPLGAGGQRPGRVAAVILRLLTHVPDVVVVLAVIVVAFAVSWHVTWHGRPEAH